MTNNKLSKVVRIDYEAYIAIDKLLPAFSAATGKKESISSFMRYATIISSSIFKDAGININDDSKDSVSREVDDVVFKIFDRINNMRDTKRNDDRFKDIIK